MNQNELEKELYLIYKKFINKSNSVLENPSSLLNNTILDLIKELEKINPNSTKIKSLRKLVTTYISQLESFTFSNSINSIDLIYKEVVKITKKYINSNSNPKLNKFRKLINDTIFTFKRSFDSLKDNALLFNNLTDKFLNNKLSETEKELFKNLTDKFKEKKFITITTKNGRERNYKVKTYIELVNRTSFANAQVQSSIDTSEANNIFTFVVTSHNTQTEICKPHENKIYTTLQKLTKYFPLLTNKNKPTYHVNCQHRLLPKPFTKKQLERMLK